METDIYRDIVRKLLAQRRSAGMIPEDMEPYFVSHWTRFRTLVEMMRDDLSPGEINTVLDIGTEFPFATLWLNMQRGAWVTFAGACEGHDVTDFARFVPLNVNRMPPDFPTADLVVCTECTEHLPVPIPAVLKWLRARTRKYLLLSFPCGGKNAHGYERDLSEQYGADAVHKGHIREYTFESAAQLVADLGMHVEDIRDTAQPAYHAPIRNVLLSKGGE